MNRKSIKKIIIALLLCLSVNIVYEIHNSVPTFAADIVVVNASNVNLRSQPSTKSKSYGKVTKGTSLTRTEERADGWSCVDYAGTPAYIKTSFLVPYSAAVAAGNAANVTSTANASATKSSSSVDYIANKNTKKFHYPSCSSVSDMKEKNKLYFSGTRDELINMGYVPCKRCHP